MYAWSDYCGTTALATGAIYDPAGDAWKAFGSGSMLDHGMYNPTTTNWTNTDAGGTSPADRYEHTALWTGRKMIIWGCFSSSTSR